MGELFGDEQQLNSVTQGSIGLKNNKAPEKNQIRGGLLTLITILVNKIDETTNQQLFRSPKKRNAKSVLITE